ncbi:hypothetical protein ACLMJK_003561 [Lecanora helva]
MIFSAVIVSSLFAVAANAQSCTTLQPVFASPIDATSTVFETTVTATSSVDCGGCSLVVSTFRAVTASVKTPSKITLTHHSHIPQVPATPTATTTISATTSESYICSPSAPNTALASSAPLSTAILYATLFGNDGDQAKLCALLNPSFLSEIKNPNINGTAVQQEVCALASIQLINSGLSNTVEAENRVAVTYLAQALFAVQVASGYAGGTNLDKLCAEIETTLIGNIFIGYVPNGGEAVKNYVCGAAAAQRRRLAK